MRSRINSLEASKHQMSIFVFFRRLSMLWSLLWRMFVCVMFMLVYVFVSKWTELGILCVRLLDTLPLVLIKVVFWPQSGLGRSVYWRILEVLPLDISTKKMNKIYTTLCEQFQNIYHTVWTVPQSKGKILERGKIDAPYTQIHDHSLSWFGPYFSFKWNDVFMEILPICV